MPVTLKYQPNKSISINEHLLSWGIDRTKTRQQLNSDFEINDCIIDLSEYHNGDISKNIIQRKDVYKNYNSEENLFSLNFDKNDKLREIEIHHGFNITLNDEIIHFSMEIEKVAEILNNLSIKKRALSHEEYFYEDLKLVIASDTAMGGDGKNLAYFYCSSEIDHLLTN